MINATDKERQEILLYNGLYTTSKVLLKNLHMQHITIEEYISETRKLFEIWEKSKEKNYEHTECPTSTDIGVCISDDNYSCIKCIRDMFLKAKGWNS